MKGHEGADTDDERRAGSSMDGRKVLTLIGHRSDGMRAYWRLSPHISEHSPFE